MEYWKQWPMVGGPITEPLQSDADITKKRIPVPNFEKEV